MTDEEIVRSYRELEAMKALAEERMQKLGAALARVDELEAALQWIVDADVEEVSREAWMRARAALKDEP